MDVPEFDLWLSRCSDTTTAGKTTLEQQIGYARKLYMEAETAARSSTVVQNHHSNDNHHHHAALKSIESTVDHLRSAPVDPDRLVSWRGIHVGWLKTFFAHSKYIQRLKQCGCPLWFVRKVCIIEMLFQKGITTGPLIEHVDKLFVTSRASKTTGPAVVKPATTFLSYTGRYRFGYFLEMIDKLDEGEYVWMDMFCVDQFAWTGRGRSEKIIAVREVLTGGLEKQIATIGKTALMLEKWNNVMTTLEQIWVLWEVFSTFEANADFRLLLSDEETRRYHECLCSGEEFLEIEDFLSSIDCRNTKAEDPIDAEKILELMTDRGIYVVNKNVAKQVRGWLASTAGNQLQVQRHTNEVNFAFVHNYSILLRMQGNYSEAEDLQQETWIHDQLTLGDALKH